MSSRLKDLQKTVADKLARSAVLRGARVISERPTSLDEKLEEKLYDDIGVNVIVKFPIPTLGSSVGGKPQFNEILLKVRVNENIPSNTLGIGAAELGEEILRILGAWTTTVAGQNVTLNMRMEYPYYSLAGSTTTNAVELRFVTAIDL